MADCVRDARAVRGLSAIAERPDGRLFIFTPYPTPVFTRDGSFAGAINLFTDVREQSEASRLNIEAQRYRRAAGALGDVDTVALLLDIADGYEAELKEALTRH